MVNALHAVTWDIAENAPAGTPVGSPVTGNPYPGETLTYLLTGEATRAFVIDPATGQISAVPNIV